MSFDTSQINKLRQDLRDQESVWVFGYGSLIYKADFPYFERKPAQIRGWSRRFWQGSHDHRGTPEHPGRVVTLVACDETCVGMAYRVAPDTFDHLDVREKNGYLRFETPLYFLDGTTAQARSEERRVGKESSGRRGRGPYDENKHRRVGQDGV